MNGVSAGGVVVVFYLSYRRIYYVSNILNWNKY